MPNDDRKPQYCCHGLKREHVVSGGGSTCNGPFQWAMSKSEANSVSDYYIKYEQFYRRSTNA